MYQGWPFQSTGSTHQRDGSGVNNITQAQDDSDSTINEQIIGYDKSVQMGSDLDDTNSDINADADSDHGGSSSGTASRSEVLRFSFSCTNSQHPYLLLRSLRITPITTDF